MTSNKKRAGIIMAACLTVPLALFGCGGGQASSASDSAAADGAQSGSSVEQSSASQASEGSNGVKSTMSEDGRPDLLVLVNKEYALPDGWEEKLELKGATNSKGDYIEVDKIAFDAFADLQKDLKTNEGITIELNSGYRSIKEQEEIRDYQLQVSGEEYVRTKVAQPGHSEHHTGLVVDALLVVDGEPMVTEDDIAAHKEEWRTVHQYLARHGFILRYLQDREDITGYPYEAWHIRYVGKDAAEQIMKENSNATLANYQDSYITLEEYLDKVPDHSVAPDATN